MEFKIPCPLCKRNSVVDLDEAGLSKYRAGALVQDAFPNLKPAERELLITGFCPTCWEKMVGTYED